jgi:hypothetical protein
MKIQPASPSQTSIEFPTLLFEAGIMKGEFWDRQHGAILSAPIRAVKTLPAKSIKFNHLSGWWLAGDPKVTCE